MKKGSYEQAYHEKNAYDPDDAQYQPDTGRRSLADGKSKII